METANKALHVGKTIAEVTNLAKEIIINIIPNDMTPQALADGKSSLHYLTLHVK